jgi:predicted  nucleic acid-binding Zn-ribbon protein
LLESKLTETYNTIQQKFEEAKTLNAEGRTWEELSTDADMLIEEITNELELIPEVTGYAKEIIEIAKKSLQGKATGLKGISLASKMRSELSDIQVEDFEFNFNDFFDTLIQNNFNFSSYLEKLQQQKEKLNEQKEKLDKIIKESSDGSEEKQDAETEKEKIENTVKEIDETMTKLENAIGKFANEFIDFLVNISGIGSEASGIIKGIVETVQLAITNAPEAIFSAFGVALKILTTIINTAQESAKNAKKIRDELAEKDFLSGKTSRTAEFEKFKKDREKEIEETLTKIEKIMYNDIFGFLKNDELNALIEKIKKLQKDTAEDTQNKFADIYGLDIDSIASIVESAFDSVDISQFNENIEMSLKQAVKKAIIQAMIDSLISSTAMKRVVEIIQQLVKTPGDPELLKKLKEETSKASELLASIFTPIFEMLKNTFPEVFGQVNTAVEAVGAVLSEETGNKIVGVFSTLSASQQRFNNLFEKYIDKASQMLDTIELTLTELKAENKENTEEIKNKIQEIIDKIETDFALNIDLKPVTDNIIEIKKMTEIMNADFKAFKNESWQTVDLILANINTIKGYIFDIREKVINGIIKVEMQNSTKFLDVNRAVGG